MNLKSDFLKEIENYYSDKVVVYGNTPKGVDWNSKKSQYLRFDNLCKILPNDTNSSFSLLDYGCGYGELVYYLKGKYPNMVYYGYDISEEMIKTANKFFFSNHNIKFLNEINENKSYDYIIANGIFSVKLQTKNQIWKNHILNTIKFINNICNNSFSFNCLTKYSDKELMRNHLYYADPLELFDFCKINISKHVALFHDYPLYEFSLHIKKLKDD